MKANTYRLKPARPCRTSFPSPVPRRATRATCVKVQTHISINHFTRPCALPCTMTTPLLHGRKSASMRSASSLPSTRPIWNRGTILTTVLVLDEIFASPIRHSTATTTKRDVSDFPFLEWVIGEYNALFDALPVLTRWKNSAFSVRSAAAGGSCTRVCAAHSSPHRPAQRRSQTPPSPVQRISTLMKVRFYFP